MSLLDEIRAKHVGTTGPGKHWLSCDEIGVLLAEFDAASAENGYLRKCIGFFASVIKSGETWTDQCEAEYAAVRQAREGKR